MNKKCIRNFSIGISFATLGLISIAATAISCSNNEEVKSEVVAINTKFAAEKAKLQNKFGLPKYTADNNYDTAGNALVENAKNAIKALKDYQNQNTNLSLNEQIWLKTYLYNWEIEINNWNNGLQYLGGNPSGNALPLNPNSNHLNDNIASAINIYQINDETLEPISDSEHIDPKLANNYPTMGQALIDYICSLYHMLQKGMENGVMPCNITKKTFITQMINNYYENEIVYWATNQIGATDGVPIKLPVVDENKTFVPTNALLMNYDVWKTWAEKQKIDKNTIEKTKESLNNAQKALDKFINWYANDYYNSEKSFGGLKEPLKLTTIAKGNQERFISASKDDKKYILYGTGITDEERNMPNVGIGFMDSTLTINNVQITGNKMYDALLKFNNSITKEPTELVNTGIEFVKTTTQNMKNVARQVALLNNPNSEESNLTWTPNVKYDEDIKDDTPPVDTVMKIYENGNLNFSEFNKWLNQENFFFGRETNFWNQDFTGENKSNNKKMTNEEAYTTNGVNPNFDNYLKILNDLGYSVWKNNEPIYGEFSVKGKQALAGAVLSLVNYNKFKDVTNEIFNYSFKDIHNYNVAPYNKKIEEIIGVGLEGPRGSNIFNYNVNPYYSLTKWSQSSFQNHEGKMGHHTQQAYWTAYMPNGNGENGTGPGYVFKQDAFHEGWAVFAEWYANELGIYGTDLDEKTRIPNNWMNAKGFVPQIKNDKNPQEDEISEIKNFQAGAYWEAASGVTEEKNRAVAATKIANMLQYYGYLNEAQLRNMRLAVDPLYHYKNSNSVVLKQNDIPNYGSSIQSIRDYLKINSGLSQGDIESESYRYLNMPSQATGYMTGKVVFENLFKQVQKQYEDKNANKKFLENKKAVKELFDIMLRNGEIPLEILQWAVQTYYKLSK